MAKDILTMADWYTAYTDDAELILGEPMRLHTSFRIGGSADMYVVPRSAEALKLGIEYARAEELPFWILGKGTNVLVSDRGLRGVVFDMTGMNAMEVNGNLITAEAGATLAQLAHLAAELSLTGLEFASGIPGSLGGAVFMNAGAYGGEMSQVVKSATVLTKSGEIAELSAEELELGYRHSALEESGAILLSAVLKLEPGDKAAIEAKMKDLNERRRDKQPLEYPSAGSTFKRPEGYFAGKLIEDAGLKGFRVGNAQVSEKHAGFVINLGLARAREVMGLIREVQSRVQAQSGVKLEPEVRLWGEFDE